ncbi:MAG: hypothetical protein Q9159_000875 [Coniocarpon cinnabarinum]
MAYDPEQVPNVLENERDKAPAELQEYYLRFEDLWERKLWHELTDACVEYFGFDESASQRRALWTGFIAGFERRINQLKRVELGLLTSDTIPGTFSHAITLQYAVSRDLEERLSFLEKLARNVNGPSTQESYVLATSVVASTRLQLGDSRGARKDLDLCTSILDSFDLVDSSVHARFYDINSTYFQKTEEFASYYKNALLYLACVDVDKMPQQEKTVRAYDLAIAALVSDSIYNFGELLLHPILDSLTGGEHAWLRDLLFAYNRGDLRAFDGLSSNLSKNQHLSKNSAFLRQKISLAALTEAVFRRPPHDRSMTFREIQSETNVQLDEIELLIMRALALGLVRGTIDQVGQLAEINWVQPKVLDLRQVGEMRRRLVDWDQSVERLGNWMEKSGREVWAA